MTATTMITIAEMGRLVVKGAMMHPGATFTLQTMLQNEHGLDTAAAAQLAALYREATRMAVRAARDERNRLECELLDGARVEIPFTILVPGTGADQPPFTGTVRSTIHGDEDVAYAVHRIEIDPVDGAAYSSTFWADAACEAADMDYLMEWVGGRGSIRHHGRVRVLISR